jgi:hypothetical protein
MPASWPKNYVKEKLKEMNDKKVVENYKSIRALEQSLPQPLRPEDIDFIKSVINDAWQNRSSIIRETRSLSEIVSDIQNDKNKSRTRKDFEIRIAKMADRMTHKKPLSVSNDATQPEQVSEPLPLHERIKFLRERLN